MSLFKRPGSPNYYCEIQVALRRLVRSTGTSNRREAEAFQRRFKEEARAEARRVSSNKSGARQLVLDYTVDQMFGRYWVEHGSKLRWRAEVAGYAKRIVGILGHLKVADMNAVDIAHMTETMRDNGTGHVAINRALAVLRGAHTMAGKRWGCSVQPIDWRLLKSREPRERIRWITRQEAARLLACLPPHSSLIVEWSLYTGLRKSETLSLAWDKINSATGFADVQVKGGHWRRIQLSEPAKSILARTPHIGRLVFDGTNLRKNFEAGLLAAGITDFRFHDLRHTNATWLRREGASLEVIQRALGHSSIQVTQRYAHVDDQEVLAASNTIAPITQSNVVRFTRVRKQQFVYFVTDGAHVKIGRSSDPARRLGTLKTDSPRPLWLIGTIRADELSEIEAHARFSAHRQRGEWFVVTGDVLKEIEALCRTLNPTHVGGLRKRLTPSGSDK